MLYLQLLGSLANYYQYFSVLLPMRPRCVSAN